MLIPTKTIKDYVLKDDDSDSSYNFNMNEIGHLKELCRSVDISPDVTRLIVDHPQEKLAKKHLNWSHIIKKQLKTYGLDEDLLLGFPDSYKDNKLPNHFNQSLLEEKVRSISIELALEFKNENQAYQDDDDSSDSSVSCDSRRLGP